MKTVANVLMNIHANIFALAKGSWAVWSLVVMVGIRPSGPDPFSTSPFLPFSSISVSDILMRVLSEALESGRSIGGERYCCVPVKRFSKEGEYWSSKSESDFIDAMAPGSWLGGSKSRA